MSSTYYKRILKTTARATATSCEDEYVGINISD